MILDETSLVITTETGIPLTKVESFLNRKGYSLGYQPIGHHAATLSDCLAKRIPNRLAARYGEIDEICMAVKTGSIETKRVPRASTGLDLKKILIGAHGAYGRIEQVVLRIIPRPKAGQTLLIHWKSGVAMQRFTKNLQASGVRAVVQKKGPLALWLRIEGEKELFDAERETLLRLIRSTGGKILKS